MDIGDVIILTFLLIVSLIAFIISFFQFKEKGFLFNNSYLYASKKERETMNKKSHYRQSAIVFLLIGIALLLLALEILFKVRWLYSAIMLIIGCLMVYAIGSSINIRRKNNENTL